MWFLSPAINNKTSEGIFLDNEAWTLATLCWQRISWNSNYLSDLFCVCVCISSRLQDTGMVCVNEWGNCNWCWQVDHVSRQVEQDTEQKECASPLSLSLLNLFLAVGRYTYMWDLRIRSVYLQINLLLVASGCSLLLHKNTSGPSAHGFCSLFFIIKQCLALFSQFYWYKVACGHCFWL